MMDTKRKGFRCRAKSMIRSATANIEPDHYGTIAYEVENFGRPMILVEWDSGVSLYVFPQEIEILDATEPP